MSRSEFFARAAQQYLKHLDAASLTAQIDRALAVADEARRLAWAKRDIAGRRGAGVRPAERELATGL